MVIYRSHIKKVLLIISILMPVLIVVTGCSLIGKSTSSTGANLEQEEQKIERFRGEPSRAISAVYTGSKELSLTFNGLGDESTVLALLDELDRYHIQAAFFLPGMRVAEEPDLAKEILNRGHTIENNTLNRLDMSELSYEQIYREIHLANEVIERETGVRPRYVRTRSGELNHEVRLAAAHLGMDAVVSYTINPKDSDMQDAQALGAYVERFISRGAIVTLNTDINPEVVPAIKYIAQAAEEVGYSFVPLPQLIQNGGERKPLEDIAGSDAARVNLEGLASTDISYDMFYTLNTTEPKIALTLDDWASDQTVTQVLDILEQYGVHATFFLRARGVEDNPNLARAILEAGHDIANHSYNHEVVTTLSPEQLQEDIVKAHQVLTAAIQEQPLMLYRPPTGVIDAEAAQIIAATGYTSIAMYDVTTLDWDVRNRAEDIVNTVMEKVQNGSIILLHILDGTNTVEALPMVIESLQGAGYTFVRLADYIDEIKSP